MPGDYVRSPSTDTGEGMAQDVLDRAFDPFFTTKGVGKGSGMGLSMVYGFAKQSGGHVTIESKSGRAHRFASTCRCRARPKRSEPCGARQDAATGGHERILFVEDEPHVRRFVSNQLTGLGYSRPRSGSRRARARDPANGAERSTCCSPTS